MKLPRLFAAALALAMAAGLAHAQPVKVSALPAAVGLGGSEVMLGVQTGANVKISAGQIRTYTLGNVNADIMPTADLTYALGDATHRVIKAYVGALNVKSAAGDTTCDYTAGVAGTTGELVCANNQSALNVIVAKNAASDGYSAFTLRGSDNYEHGTFGYGNPTTPFPWQGATYIEASQYPGSGTTAPPLFRLVQTGYWNGAYGSYRRYEETNDGWQQFFGWDGNTIGLVISNAPNVRVPNGSLTVGITGDTTAGAIAANSFVKAAVVAVASLPTCNSTIEGARMGVNNANATTFNSTVAAGGSNHVPVYCNGTNWVIG